MVAFFSALNWWQWVIIILILFMMFAGFLAGDEGGAVFGFLMIFVLIIFCGSIYVYRGHFFTDTKKIEKKIRKMNQLENTMVKKSKESINLRNAYQKEIDILGKEVKAKKDQNNITSYSQAAKNAEIYLKLSQIQHKQAYIDKLNDIIPKLELGSMELKDLQIKAKDDLRMVNVLGKDAIGNLAKDIDQILKKYKPDDFVVKIDESHLESPEQIWNRIAR